MKVLKRMGVFRYRDKRSLTKGSTTRTGGYKSVTIAPGHIYRIAVYRTFFEKSKYIMFITSAPLDDGHRIKLRFNTMEQFDHDFEEVLHDA